MEKSSYRNHIQIICMFIWMYAWVDDQIVLLNQWRKCYIRFIVLAGFHKHIVSEGSERTLHRARGYHQGERLALECHLITSSFEEKYQAVQHCDVKQQILQPKPT